MVIAKQITSKESLFLKTCDILIIANLGEISSTESRDSFPWLFFQENFGNFHDEL